MKFPDFLQSRQEKELKRFQSLGMNEKSIVFYAEDDFSIMHFKPILNELTKNLGRKVCYLTSSPTDPILNTNNKMIKSFYVGNGTTKTKLFLTLKAGVLIMTMPDLETFHIKRSKIYPVHYIYVFHSIVSTHMVYRKGAFDNYDTILCVGKHHIKEIRETERIYGLKTKNLLEHGYGRLDTLLQNNFSSSLSEKYSKNVLIATSWGQNALLEKYGVDLVKILLENKYFVTVRPHPVTIKKWPKVIKSLKDNFDDNSKFNLETDVQRFDSLQRSQFMISDWSGIALEYAFSSGRPILYIDVPKKIHNNDYEKISYIPIEESMKEKLGCVLSPNELNKVPQKLEFLYKNLEFFKKQIFQIRSEIIFNLGRSGEVGAKYIAKIADEQKQ